MSLIQRSSSFHTFLFLALMTPWADLNSMFFIKFGHSDNYRNSHTHHQWVRDKERKSFFAFPISISISILSPAFSKPIQSLKSEKQRTKPLQTPKNSFPWQNASQFSLLPFPKSQGPKILGTVDPLFPYFSTELPCLPRLPELPSPQYLVPTYTYYSNYTLISTLPFASP